MEWFASFALMVGLVGGLMAIGLPVVFVFFAVNIVGAIAFMGGAGAIDQIVRNSADSLATFNLVPIPFFVFMGEIFFHSGLVRRVFDAIDKCLGRLPARLSFLTIGGGTLFAALSGSSLANAAMLGSLMLPEMNRRGYASSVSIGPILGAGSLAMLIPPSTLAVVLGSLGKIDIGALLIAGIVPGLLLAVLYVVLIATQILVNPNLAPSYDVPSIAVRAWVVALVLDILPMSIVIFLVTGSIFFGIATPTEAAALGAFGVFVIAAAWGRMSLRVLGASLMGTLKISAMTLIIIAGSSTFSQVLAYSGASQGLVGWFLDLGTSPLTTLTLMFVVLLILGMFMDQISMMMITLPVFLPIAHALGFDMVWFGLIMLLGLEIGLTTPPFGLLLFIVKGVAPPQTSMAEIVRAGLPYIGCVIALAVLVAVFPDIALLLPRVAGYKGAS